MKQISLFISILIIGLGIGILSTSYYYSQRVDSAISEEENTFAKTVQDDTSIAKGIYTQPPKSDSNDIIEEEPVDSFEAEPVFTDIEYIVSANQIIATDNSGAQSVRWENNDTKYTIDELVVDKQHIYLSILLGRYELVGPENDNTLIGSRLIILDNKDLSKEVRFTTSDKFGENMIGYLSDPTFDDKAENLYVNSNYGGPGTIIFEIDTKSLTIKNAYDGSLDRILPSTITNPMYAQYAGWLVVWKHLYYPGGLGGSYDEGSY